MKKSRFPIYDDEIRELSYSPYNIFDKWFMKATRKLTTPTLLSYTFYVPVSEYLRGELFCDDVTEAANEKFTHIDLLTLLLDDFLFQAKKRSNPVDLYHELTIRSQNAIKINSYQEDESEILVPTNGPKKKMIKCLIHRKQALRLEVMLSDIAELNMEHTFEVNDVLRMLYSDFILQYKNGNLSNVVDNIIQRLSQ